MASMSQSVHAFSMPIFAAIIRCISVIKSEGFLHPAGRQILRVELERVRLSANLLCALMAAGRRYDGCWVLCYALANLRCFAMCVICSSAEAVLCTLDGLALCTVE